MSKLTTFIKLSKQPKDLIKPMVSNGFLKWISDEQIARIIFKSKFDRKLNLDDPKSFNEKLQWLKLYYRKPIFTTMVDKYKVRQYVGKKIGHEYLIPLLGVWDNANEIDFEKLPDKFVLKCNHDQGSVIICKDKSALDLKRTRNYLNKRLKKNHYWATREWPYKNVPRKIIAEKYMVDDSNSNEFTDYKFFSFNGHADCVMVCTDRDSGEPKFYFFDKDWNLKRHNIRGEDAPKDFTIPKPKCIDEMFDIASKLSEDIPFVRVDLYQSYGKIYFGEMTFYPKSGFDSNIVKKSDEYFGKLIDLSLIKNN